MGRPKKPESEKVNRDKPAPSPGVETQAKEASPRGWKQGTRNSLDYHKAPAKERLPRYRRKEMREKFLAKNRLKYQTPDEMAEVIQQYFEDCDKEKTSYTLAGLAYYLGFSSRQALLDYEGREEFHEVVARAKLRIEMQRSEQLVHGQGVVAGQIFDLKCNFNWREPAQQIDMNNPDGNMGTKVVTVLPSQPMNLDEWQKWYDQMIEDKRQQEAIDVTPEQE